MNKANLAIALGILAPVFASGQTGSASRSCPLRTKAYGGIPGGGGFGCEREYNIAAQRYFEAAHCLLGSLGRVGRDENWTEMRIRERGHIKEEIGIMMDVVQEYQKQVYLDQFNPNRYRDVQQAIECNRLAIKDIQESSTRLIETAEKEKQNLIQNRSTIPEDVFEIANLTYRCIIVTAQALLGSIEDNKLVSNAWKEPLVRIYTNRLNTAIGSMYDE